MNYKKQDRNKDCVQSIGLTTKLKMVGWFRMESLCLCRFGSKDHKCLGSLMLESR